MEKKIDIKNKVLLFDFDGTLVETEIVAKKVIDLYFLEKNFPHPTPFAEMIVGRTWKAAAENMHEHAKGLGVDLDPPTILQAELKMRYQDAFKAFVEEYSAKNVRFILSTNNISKVMPGIKSRFTEINFDCQNIEEEKFVKREIYKRVKDIILKEENFDIDKENLIKIINKRYPDIRKILNDIQHFKITGDLNISINDTKTKISL